MADGEANTIEASDEQTGKRSRARASRGVEVRRERRRRDDLDDQGGRKKLGVDETKLDRKNFHYRWANDDASRMQRLTEFDDWDQVPEKEVGFATRRQTARGKDGEIQAQVLLRKPKDWHEADHHKKQARIDDRLIAAQQGEPLKGDGGGLNAANAYSSNHPESANLRGLVNDITGLPGGRRG